MTSPYKYKKSIDIILFGFFFQLCGRIEAFKIFKITTYRLCIY